MIAEKVRVSLTDIYFPDDMRENNARGQQFCQLLSNELSINAQTASYTAALTDAQCLVTMTNASANAFMLPTNASVPFPIGTQILVQQLGTGATTISAVNSGTTSVVSTGATVAAPACRAQYSSAICVKLGLDSWSVMGDIA